ncbi:putative bifunctional diguanylate cyclase/phosphodiesterase [Umezawaea endophytica]|uniref:EAL domain-containing protein n=1 Tax=Umezawaea endophytica TaxID=1654476 RepID=A0A9X2VHX0_9PSEU|nr:EAL domain-containing protein [Umezawaea endophytica]MCS7476424.1 EAL domain-containing protein [Umezawaea endophytica]
MTPQEPPPRTRRQELAREWMKAVYSTTYVPMSSTEIELYLLDLVDVIADAIQAEPFSAEPVGAVGDRMVSAHFTGLETLQRTVEVLGHALLFTPELAGVDRLAEKVVAILGALAARFATAMRLDAFDQQEEIKWALLQAKQGVERTLKLSEARFHEVFGSSALGIAITGLDGTVIEANDAMAAILGGDGDLVGESLLARFHPDDTHVLTESYRGVREGVVDRFREQHRLIRSDGEPAWVYLAVSLLRDADGEPAYHVTMVEDVSELHLMQKNLDFLLLHDSLTGLSNRQHFITQLEAVHSRSERGITLYHLDLDSFSLINNGLGHATGDRLLKQTAQRLTAVVAGENTVVARIGGDEFAIVVDNSATTPGVTTMIDMINDELAEPTFVDDRGVALTASIGVLDRPSRDWTVGELLRAANMTLHRAKAKGKRQWLPYDPHEDSRHRTWADVAASMPGALENGEIEVDFQPVVALADRTVVGVAAQLRWGTWGHRQCLELAEETGLSLPVGQWMLRHAGELVARWREDAELATVPLHVSLGPMQSRDEDLVGAVKRTLDETGLPVSELRISLNTRAVLTGGGDDNVQVLADSGISTGLTAFHGGQDELALLTELPITSVTIAGADVRRLAAEPDRDSLLHNAMAALVSVVHRAGVTVVATGVASEDEAAWWAAIGADAAQGEFFAPPLTADEVTGLFHRN